MGSDALWHSVPGRKIPGDEDSDSSGFGLIVWGLPQGVESSHGCSKYASGMVLVHVEVRLLTESHIPYSGQKRFCIL